MDTLNKFDPLPCSFGPVVRQPAKPTPAELREKELREFETKTDKPAMQWFSVNSPGMPLTSADIVRIVNESLDELCGVQRTFMRVALKQPDPNQPNPCRQGDDFDYAIHLAALGL